ncbi:outer dense fiber protein 3-like [Gigantopelta aegis]|uniref:outer dense fiber protein 3-like n=1 Tax=Gigantopelta aegis TaxID=1735272 RepID=UPI001B8877A6|nr:outer dense fiber protein 3-like [Gigantopelta aegis]
MDSHTIHRIIKALFGDDTRNESASSLNLLRLHSSAHLSQPLPSTAPSPTFSYSIPPFFGNTRHPTQQGAPAYSFGSRYSYNAIDNPGPGAYRTHECTPRGRYTIVGGRFGGRPRSRSPFGDHRNNFGPGPNVYRSDIVSPRAKRAPSYSFGLRHELPDKSITPGSNFYNLPTTLGQKAAPPYKTGPAAGIKGRLDHGSSSYDWAKTPGPAQYGVSDKSIGNTTSSRITLKGRTPLPTFKMITPGPGAYDLKNNFSDKKRSPGYSIGGYHSDKAIPVFTLADVSF